MNISIEEIIEKLALKPLENEGGYYAETYKSAHWLKPESLPVSYLERRAFSTCIYYLITPESFSRMHRLPADEIWHFYLGDAAEQLQLFPDGTGKIITLGNALENGEVPQMVVPAFVWQGTRVKPGGRFALFGTTVSPGFEFPDFTAGVNDRLVAAYPAFENEINLRC